MLFRSMLAENFSSVKTVVLNNRSRRRDFSNAYNYARNAQIIFLPYFLRAQNDDSSLKLSKKYLAFIKKVLRLRTPSVLIDFGNPYIISDLPQTMTYICAYNDVEVSQIAALKAIIGKIPFRGKLPVSIPKTKYKLGFRL